MQRHRVPDPVRPAVLVRATASKFRRRNRWGFGGSMTKRAKVSATAGVRINERELAVLRQIARVNSTVVSVSQLSADFSCSLATVRNVIRSLEHKGLISVQARFLRNGGQLENEYEVTQEGIRVLECDDALAKDER